MSIFALVAASLIAVPVGTQQLLLDAYPTRALRENKSGAVQMRLWLDPDGKVYRCEVLQVFGDEIFGKEACKPTLKVKMTRPAAPDGGASFGMTTSLVKYTIRDRAGERVRTMREIPDVVLRAAVDPLVSKVPDFQIAVQVQPNGSIIHCEGIEAMPVALAEPACHLARQQSWARGTDTSGNPISYVTSLRVRIEATPPS